MTRSARALLLALPLLAACGASASATGGEGGDRDARFVGLWVVDNGLDHLWRASLYDLREDGSLRHLRDAAFLPGQEAEVGVLTLDPAEAECMGGTGPCSPDVQCLFGEAWWSEGPSVLDVLVECDDGTTRRARLGFASPPEEDAVAAEVEVEAVDEGAGWALLYDTAFFRRCPEGAGDCLAP